MSGRPYHKFALREWHGFRFLLYQLLLRLVFGIQAVMRWLVR